MSDFELVHPFKDLEKIVHVDYDTSAVHKINFLVSGEQNMDLSISHERIPCICRQNLLVFSDREHLPC